jgi:hypothetical protein
MACIAGWRLVPERLERSSDPSAIPPREEGTLRFEPERMTSYRHFPGMARTGTDDARRA